MDFKLEIDVDELKKQVESSGEKLEEKVRQAVSGLAAQTHAKVIEHAQRNLRSTRRIYIDNMFIAQIHDSMWVVGLREEAMWIEEGMEPHSMVRDLLKGRKYRVIPFDQGKPTSEVPVAMTSLAETLRKELRKHKIPLKKIERNPDGSPKLGLLHNIDIDSKEKGPTGTPYLQGLRVYQQRDKSNPEKINRYLATFRTVSENHEAQGRWFHPGLQAKKFLDKAFKWAINEWDTAILPELMKGISD